MPARLTRLFAVMLLLAGTVAADAYPEAALRARVEQVMEFSARHPRATAAEVSAFLARTVLPFIDFAEMAEGVAGPLNRRLSAGKRQRLTAALRRHMLATMAKALAGHRWGEVRYLPVRDDPANGEARVGLETAGPGGLPLRFRFRMRRGPSGWRIVDASLNGFSAVALYRDAFGEWVERYGFEGALDRLG